MGIAREPLETEVCLIFVGEDDDLHIKPDGRETELGLVRIDHDSGFAAAQTHRIQSEVGDFHRRVVYMRSGAETPINPSAFLIVVLAATES